MTLGRNLWLAAACVLLASGVPFLYGQERPRNAQPTAEERAREDLERGRRLAFSGRTNEALGVLTQAARRAPRTETGAECLFDASTLLWHRRDWIEAFETCQQMINHFPGTRLFDHAIVRQHDLAAEVVNHHRRRSMGAATPRVPKPDMMVRMLRLAVENAPHHVRAPDSLFLLGGLLQESGTADDAVAVFQNLADSHPQHPLADDAAFQVVWIRWRANGDGREKGVFDKTRNAALDFLARWPESDRIDEARAVLAALDGQEVLSREKIAAFYERTGKPEAAAYYRRPAPAGPVAGPDDATLGDPFWSDDVRLDDLDEILRNLDALDEDGNAGGEGGEP